MPRPNEAKTRKELIDPALKRAGWDINNPEQVGTEIPVDGTDAQTWAISKKLLKETKGAYNVELPPGISDYALYRSNGDIIAIVEAKKPASILALLKLRPNFMFLR